MVETATVVSLSPGVQYLKRGTVRSCHRVQTRSAARQRISALMEQHETRATPCATLRNNEVCRHQPYCPTVSHTSENLRKCTYADQPRLSFAKTLFSATTSANVTTSNCIRRIVHNRRRHLENHGTRVRLAEEAHEVARAIRDVQKGSQSAILTSPIKQREVRRPDQNQPCISHRSRRRALPLPSSMATRSCRHQKGTQRKSFVTRNLSTRTSECGSASIAP